MNVLNLQPHISVFSVFKGVFTTDVFHNSDKKSAKKVESDVSSALDDGSRTMALLDSSDEENEDSKEKVTDNVISKLSGCKALRVCLKSAKHVVEQMKKESDTQQSFVISDHPNLKSYIEPKTSIHYNDGPKKKKRQKKNHQDDLLRALQTAELKEKMKRENVPNRDVSSRRAKEIVEKKRRKQAEISKFVFTTFYVSINQEHFFKIFYKFCVSFRICMYIGGIDHL